MKAEHVKYRLVAYRMCSLLQNAFSDAPTPRIPTRHGPITLTVRLREMEPR